MISWMDASYYVLLVLAFISGSVLTALVGCFCCCGERKRAKDNQPGLTCMLALHGNHPLVRTERRSPRPSVYQEDVGVVEVQMEGPSEQIGLSRFEMGFSRVQMDFPRVQMDFPRVQMDIPRAQMDWEPYPDGNENAEQPGGQRNWASSSARSASRMIRIERFRPKSRLLLFPDGKLPCRDYSDYLMDDIESCRCVRVRSSHVLHTGEPETSLVKIMRRLAAATRTIDLCVFLFTIEQVAQLLVKLNKDVSVRIRVVSDAGRMKEENNKGDKIPVLQREGIEVHERPFVAKDYRPLMHHKFVIIDDQICLLGSFNWTNQAVRYNNESVIETNDPEIIAPLRVEFNNLWDQFPRAANHDDDDD